MKRRPILLGILAVGAMAGCASPSYVDKGAGQSGWLGLNEVTFEVSEAFRATPPDCVAVLPLVVTEASKPMASAEDAAKVRRSLYAHLATQSKRSVRLERVDHLLAEVRGDRKALAERLKCDALIEGEVTEYGSSFYGLYSRVAAGANLKMVRPTDGAVLWEGQHVATSHGGSVPLDPVGIAMGVADAASNVRDEQILRVTDDLARRLVSTIPDNQVMALDDPADHPARTHTRVAPADDLAVAEQLLAQGDHAGAIAAADKIIATAPDRAEAWFVKGRALMLERDFGKAEPAILKAAALAPHDPSILNALGAVNAERGATDRALAAYRMAIDADRGNGFAWFNTAVIHYQAGEPREAADAFTGAALAYLKAGDYAHAERALGELRDLARAGIPVQREIETVQSALSDLSRRKS